MRVPTLIPAFVLLTSQVLADCGPGPAQNSFIACAASLDTNSITGCVQDNPQQTSNPSAYNFAACSCSSLSMYSSCLEPYCPAQVTQDVLDAQNYYCDLATGGTPTFGVAAATQTGAGAAAGTGGGNGNGNGGTAQTGTAAGTGSGAQSTGKRSGAGIVEPVLGMGVGLVAVLGVVGGWL